MYCAVVLEDKDRYLLQIALTEVLDIEASGYLFQTYQGMPLPHHMTVNLGNFDELLNCTSMKGMPCNLVVKEFCYDHEIGVCAAKVEEATCCIVGDERQANYHALIRTNNSVPHITMCIRPPAKPADSNRLDWTKGRLKLSEPITVHGKIEDGLS